MKQKATKPVIRFEGFTDDWEQRKLGDFLTERKEMRVQDDEYPLVSFTVEKGVTPKTDRYEREQLVVGNKKSKKYKVTELNDIVYNPANLKFGAISMNKFGRAVFSPIYVTFQVDTNKAIPFFIESYVTRRDFIKFSLKYQQGTVYERQSVSVSDFIQMNVNIPSKKEQQKIGSFFKQLDDTIALHQRQLEALEKTKKSFLQKMFPKKDETKPEIRFAGFTDDWEQRKLGEVVNFLNGRAYKQKELLESGKYRVLRVGNFNTNDRWYYSDLELDEDKYADKGDLLYLWATNFGPEIWKEERVIYHYHIWKIQFLSKEIDKHYLYTWLLTDKERIKQTTNGTTMVHVTKGSIEQRKFQYPINMEEQQKIGTFFKQLDETIALHQRQLEALETTKKSFLQKMFI